MICICSVVYLVVLVSHDRLPVPVGSLFFIAFQSQNIKEQSQHPTVITQTHHKQTARNAPSFSAHKRSVCVSVARSLQREYEQLRQQHGQSGAAAVSGAPEEADLLAEAKLLRQHKGRLEARMQILEDHNKQLESQLYRLRQLLHQVTHLST